jgi:hypothetical protein
MNVGPGTFLCPHSSALIGARCSFEDEPAPSQQLHEQEGEEGGQDCRGRASYDRFRGDKEMTYFPERDKILLVDSKIDLDRSTKVLLQPCAQVNAPVTEVGEDAYEEKNDEKAGTPSPQEKMKERKKKNDEKSGAPSSQEPAPREHPVTDEEAENRLEERLQCSRNAVQASYNRSPPPSMSPTPPGPRQEED